MPFLRPNSAINLSISPPPQPRSAIEIFTGMIVYQLLNTLQGHCISTQPTIDEFKLAQGLIHDGPRQSRSSMISISAERCANRFIVNQAVCWIRSNILSRVRPGPNAKPTCVCYDLRPEADSIHLAIQTIRLVKTYFRISEAPHTPNGCVRGSVPTLTQ